MGSSFLDISKVCFLVSTFKLFYYLLSKPILLGEALLWIYFLVCFLVSKLLTDLLWRDQDHIFSLVLASSKTWWTTPIGPNREIWNPYISDVVTFVMFFWEKYLPLFSGVLVLVLVRCWPLSEPGGQPQLSPIYKSGIHKYHISCF